jgi:roadblock/LC7 domain-containing protein
VRSLYIQYYGHRQHFFPITISMAGGIYIAIIMGVTRGVWAEKSIYPLLWD